MNYEGFLGWGWLKLLAAIGGMCRLFEAISGFRLGVMAVDNVGGT
jgi:hypothetical protein